MEEGGMLAFYSKRGIFRTLRNGLFDKPIDDDEIEIVPFIKFKV